MAVFEATVGRGGRNLVHDVAAIQAALSLVRGVGGRPLWSGPVDGAWARHGPALEAAVAGLQQAHHIPPTGRVEPVGATQGRLPLLLSAQHRGLRGLPGTTAVYRLGGTAGPAGVALALPKAERAALEALLATWRRAPGLPMALVRTEATADGRFKAVLAAAGVEWFDAGARRFDVLRPIPDAAGRELLKAPTGNAVWRPVARAGAWPEFELVGTRALAALAGPPRLTQDALGRFRIASPPDDPAARACIAACARLLAAPPAAHRNDLAVLVEALDAAAPEVAAAIRLAEGPDPGDVFDAEPTEDRGRPLTAGEVALAKTVFGDVLDYNIIRIYRREYELLFGFQDDDTIMAPDGNMYFGSHIKFIDDFSLLDVAAQAWFIHEMTHIWQVQVLKWGVMEMIRRRSKNKHYGYEFKPEKAFSEYGMEQQASIVADYFLMRRGQTPHRASGYTPSLVEVEAMLPFRRSR